MLIEAFCVLSETRNSQSRLASALVTHKHAGRALWAEVLSIRVDVSTVQDITKEAAARNDTDFLLQIENLIPTLDIEPRGR